MNDRERSFYMLLCAVGRVDEAAKYREDCERKTSKEDDAISRQSESMDSLEKIHEAYPDWPKHIRHGEYIGALSGIQPLLEGNAAPLYRFPGGECVGIDYKIEAVRIPPVKNEKGMVYCGVCGVELSCNACGDMPDVCPSCYEGIDWTVFKKEC